MVMMSERARCAIDSTTRTSFAADLKKWLQIMETYESGAHALDQLGLMAEPLAA
jgi:aspartate aminotransferase-like enzyme